MEERDMNGGTAKGMKGVAARGRRDTAKKLK